MTQKISLTLNIWRQKTTSSQGKFENYQLSNLSEDLSLLEVLDQLNEDLIRNSQRPVNFDHDCREGICGSCGFLINGQAHGPLIAATACQLYLRHITNGEVLTLEPWRAKAFPIIQDLTVDRSSLDRLIASGGFYSINTGDAPDADNIKIDQGSAFSAFETATCIGCGACVASCRNSSASLFVAAKLAHLGQLPQGETERGKRIEKMKEQISKEAFGNCSNQLECEAVCPKQISADWISWMNKENSFIT